MEKMREIMLCIVVAFSLTTHPTTAAPPNYGYGGFNGSTHLVGRDGLCLDIVKLFVERYIPTRLSPCEPTKQSQLWTILEDGTIRTLNNRYCLVPCRNTIGANVIIGECRRWRKRDKVWSQKKDRTVVHVDSGLVLTGKLGKFVTLESNENATSQSWEATEALSPMVANIKWLRNLCLQSMNTPLFVWLYECNKETKEQRWAFYGDGTIRVDDDRNYCLTSLDENSNFLVTVSVCGDKPQQRWSLNVNDSTINHPNTDMVMDVIRPYLLPLIVVINERDATRPNQQWTINF